MFKISRFPLSPLPAFAGTSFAGTGMTILRRIQAVAKNAPKYAKIYQKLEDYIGLEALAQKNLKNLQ